MSSFDNLKKNRDAAIAKLVDAAAKVSAPNKPATSEKMWQISCDKTGNGFAVIRFLPAKEGEDLPWVRVWSHGFKGEKTGRWYIENSLSTLGLPDPLGAYNTAKWNSGSEVDKEGVRTRKRKLHYYSNILVISDPANPENEGKVFFYSYGKKIFDKITESMQPEFPDDVPVNPFDIWTGANFKLKIRQVEGYRNYDKSEFDKPSELFAGDEARQKEVYESLGSLNEFIDPKNFKSYEELERKLMEVLGESTPVSTQPTGEPSRSVIGRTEAAPVIASAEAPAGDEEDGDDGDDTSLSYFSRLAKS